MRVSLLGDLEQ